MRTTARIVIIFIGAVILTAEIATPSAHADRGLAGGKDFWAMAYRDTAMLPRPQQGPGPERLREFLVARNVVVVVSATVRAQPMLDGAQRERPVAWSGNQTDVALAFGGGHAGNARVSSEGYDPNRFAAIEADVSDGGRKAFHRLAL